VAGDRCDAGLLRELESWRHDGEPERGVDVFVTYAGDPAALTAAGLEFGHHDGEVATGTVRLADVAALEAVPGVRWLSASARTHLLIDRSMPEIKATAVRAQAPPYTVAGAPGLTGKGVLVGVIDDRIEYFHRSFIKPGTDPQLTRLVAIYDQYDLVDEAHGKIPPAGFSTGVLWDEAAINSVLKSKALGAIPLHSNFDHGSHVAGIAAGNGSFKDGQFAPYTFVGVAPEADLAFCNGLLTAGKATEALTFLFGVAGERGQPCVVNMSFGTHEGARDGSSELERAIDRALHGADGEPLPGRAVVVAAGNEADVRRHGRKSIAANGSITFRLDIEKITFPNGTSLAEDLMPDVLYFWYDGAASIELRVTPARSTPGDWLNPGGVQTIRVGGKPVATSASAGSPDPFSGKKKIEITLPAPVRLGRWTVELREIAGVPATVDVWVERSDIEIWPQLGP
jgi:subtilisin family serine protease